MSAILTLAAFGAPLTVLAAPLDSPTPERPTPERPTPDIPLRDLAVTSWSTDDGLPASALTNALQTEDGYLWISSFNGLIRFDGKELTVFDKRSTPALETSGIYELVEDRSGQLWIGTQGAGVTVYRQGRFEPLPAARMPQLTVRAILIDDQDTVWVGSGDFGAYRYRGGRWSAVDHAALREVTVRDIVQDRHGAIWFATDGKGIVRLQGGVFTQFTTESGLSSDSATSLCEAADGTIWAGTVKGLNRIDGSRVHVVEELASAEIFRLYLDGHGHLWIAAEQALIRRNGRTGAVERLGSADGKPLRSISAIIFGHEGDIWIVSYIDGIFQLQESKFKSYTSRQGLSTDRVNVVYEAPDGEYLVGGDGGKVDVIHGTAVRPLDLDTEMPKVRIRGILRDRRDRLWIASYAGLLQITGAEERWYTAGNGLPSNQLRLLYEDSSGRIWIATSNAGLVQWLESDGFQVIDRSSGLGSDLVFSVEEAPDGRLMIGTSQGLSILAPDGSIVTYGSAEGLPGAIVFSSFSDSTGAVWLATNDGLARLYRNEIRHVNSGVGLPAEAIFDYREDDRGRVWLSSSVGVVRALKDQLIAVMNGEEERVEAMVYDESDGMVRQDCTGAAKIEVGRDGRLWFPTLDGVAVLDPDDIPINRVPPPVKIHGFIVDGRPIDLYGHDGGRLELDAGTKECTFRFAALSFLAPDKVRVRYQLAGFDDDWIEAGAERSVRYTNLSPGDYSFRVIAANNDGIWNEHGATLSLYVKSFWYQRPLFIAAMSLLIVAGAGSLYRWRLKNVRARNTYLESLIAEQRKTERDRLRAIRELEMKNAELERFTYTVSHDLKSPLVTIKGFLGYLERDAGAGNMERVRQDVERISAATDTMSRLLGELLELSRIGRVVSDPREVRLDEVAHEAREMLAGMIAASGGEVRIHPGLPVVEGDRARLLEVFQNLLENAVKHTVDGTAPCIEIGSRQDGSEAVLYVRDNGRGIEPRYHDKVFVLFERLDAKTEGTGVGLALVKRIVEVHGGRIWVESKGLGHGSTFCFTL